MDKKLNISEAYLRPGPPFGGSCLPKEIRALQKLTGDKNRYPLLHAILPSNEQRKQEIFDFILTHKKKSIGILGISFKSGTDDMRESPTLEMIKKLQQQNYALYFYDPNIKKSELLPLNEAYLNEQFPEFFNHFCSSLQEIAAKADLLLLTTNDPSYTDILPYLTDKHTVIDFYGLLEKSTHLWE